MTTRVIGPGERRLGTALRRFRVRPAARERGDGGRGESPRADPGASASPCAYGRVLEARLVAMEDAYRRLETKVNWLLFLIFGTFVSVILDAVVKGR